MASSTGSLLQSLALLTAATGLAAFVLSALYRQYRRSYLGRWRRSWQWLLLYYAASFLALWAGLAAALPPSGLLALNMVTNTAAYLHAVYLLFGSWELRHRERVSRRRRRGWSAVATVVGCGVTGLFAWSDADELLRLFLRTGLRGLVYGLAFTISGLAAWRAFHREGGIGHRLLAASMVAYGAEGLVLFGFGLASLLGDRLLPQQVPLRFTEVIPQIGIVAGMVIVLLEEERQATQRHAEQAEYLASHDPLTGLANRTLFLDRLRTQLGNPPPLPQSLAVAYLDVDQFKQINEAQGHARGDLVMRALGQRLRGLLRSGDLAARMGGDEFTVMLRVSGPVEAELQLGRIREGLCRPLQVDSGTLSLSTTVGLAVATDPTIAAEPLLDRADLALRAAKQLAPGTVRLYEAADGESGRSRELDAELRAALADPRQFVLHYQPVVDSASRRVLAAEALVRWQRADGQLVPPAAFVPYAEARGLIGRLGRWVLRETCRQTACWRQQGHPGLQVAVNLSVQQLQELDFLATLMDLLDEHALPGDALQLEITETHAMQDTDLVEFVLARTKELGLRVVLDDFGTGYSSLAYLQRLPIDGVKIDASLVRALHDGSGATAIVRAILGLAAALNLEVTAEGVEDEQQLQLLHELGCRRIQGYRTGRPMPAADLESLLRAS